ncbi:hypothetical protein [Castellaniella caeni]|uniref:hypothetical protein n=1 Tax=Castellaniella caeni TaxID=266123 RepID=UPI000C9F7342|nr:hypothetical protein [Castellaniella caeni]
MENGFSFSNLFSQLGQAAQPALDLGNRTIAAVIGSLVDAIEEILNAPAYGAAALGLGSPTQPTFRNSVGSSEWIKQRMQGAGMLGDTQPGLSDAAVGLLPFIAGPVRPGAVNELRGLLEALQRGERAKPVDVGVLTPQQFQQLNAMRQANGQPELATPNLIYKGRHHLESRSKDGYSIDELLKQIESGLSADSIVTQTRRNPVLVNPNVRMNESGSLVNDTAVINGQMDGRGELFSVIPKGDRPKKKP